MCGRYQLRLPLEEVRAFFQFENAVEAFPPRYNIAPTQPIHVVIADGGGRSMMLMRWGLLPSWVKDPKAFPLLINARSETVAEKPAFRNALRRRRALIPATGFYEWRTEGTVKQPYFFERDGDGPLFAFAGLYETWCGPNGEELDTATILTGAAEGVPAQYHGRMPLTVPAERFSDWLDPLNENGADALEATQKAAFSVRPVSRRLSNARNEGVGLMTPDPAATPTPSDAPSDATDDEDAPRLL